MKYLTEVQLDGTQDGGEVGRIMITTADGSIFFIQEEFGSKRLIIDSYNKSSSISIEPKSSTSVYINIKKK